MASPLASDPVNEPPRDRAPAGDPIRTAPLHPSPPLAPEGTSPWWTAPSGKPVNIPAFARSLVQALLDWLLPRPQPVPVKIKARR